VVKNDVVVVVAGLTDVVMTGVTLLVDKEGREDVTDVWSVDSDVTVTSGVTAVTGELVLRAALVWPAFGSSLVRVWLEVGYTVAPDWVVSLVDCWFWVGALLVVGWFGLGGSLVTGWFMLGGSLVTGWFGLGGPLVTGWFGLGGSQVTGWFMLEGSLVTGWFMLGGSLVIGWFGL
jgi:hypothetical protein